MAETAVASKRKHVSEFVIQQKTGEGDGAAWAWTDTPIGKGSADKPLDSTAACVSALRQAEIEGTFRIINITKPAFQVKAEKVTRMLIE